MRITVILTLLSLSFLCPAQKNLDAVVMTLEDEEITVRDFEYIFKKNNEKTSTSKADLDEYIELFVNYKLKVKAAKDAKLDTNKAFITELAGYRKQLARPYLTDGDLLDQLIIEAYDRKKTEIKARHILVKTSANDSPEDTLKAWNKIHELKARVENGEDFAKVAKGRGGSEDPSVQNNGGDLGYFSVFQMVYPFEEAAYTTPVGSVSKVLKTRYGYHILEVLDKRPARGQIKVAHIMTKSPENASKDQSQKAQEKIHEIYQKYLNGESFEELAKKYSEDASTSKTGGELPWFGTRKMVQVFEDVSFSLKELGDVSEPFQTEYGWHIVKKLDEKNVGDFEELKSEIKNKVSKDTRAEVTRVSFLSKLKQDYKIKVKRKNLKFYQNSIDTNFFDRNWEMKYPKKLSKTTLKIESQKYLLSDFDKFLKKKKRRASNITPEDFLNETFENWFDEALLEYEDSQLENKHEPFRQLMQEYNDGILLFELTDQKVWSKAIKDTTGLKSYFEQNRANYVWPDRYNCDVFSSNSDEYLGLASDYFVLGYTRDSIMNIINEKSSLNLTVESGLFSEESHPILTKSKKQEGSSDVLYQDGKFFMVHIYEIIPSFPKEMDEAKGLITSDYQNFLEKEWVESLREKYNYKVNLDVLYSIADE